MSDLLYRIECHVRETRMHWYKRFQEPKLYRYADYMKYRQIETRCEKYPRRTAKEAKFQHEYAPQQTPLHRALEPLFLLGGNDDNEADIDWSEIQVTRHRAVAALLEANPDAALVPCSFGTTPLMMACMDPHGTTEDVEMLLKECPKCATEVDLQGRVALHYACIINRSNRRMIEALLLHCREAADVKDNFGRLPLHYMALADPKFEGYQVLEDRLIRQSKKAAMCTKDVAKLILVATRCEEDELLDKSGLVPLHYMCRYLDEHHDDNNDKSMGMDFWSVFLLLAQASPRYVMENTYDDGRSPIGVVSVYRSKLFSSKSKCIAGGDDEMHVLKMQVIENILNVNQEANR